MQIITSTARKIESTVAEIESRIQIIQSSIAESDNESINENLESVAQHLKSVRKNIKTLLTANIRKNKVLIENIKGVLDGYGDHAYDYARIAFSKSNLVILGEGEGMVVAGYLDEYFGNRGIAENEWQNMIFEENPDKDFDEGEQV